MEKSYPIKIVQGNYFAIALPLSKIVWVDDTKVEQPLFPKPGDLITVSLVGSTRRYDMRKVSIDGNIVHYECNEYLELGTYAIELRLILTDGKKYRSYQRNRITIVATDDESGTKNNYEMSGAVLLYAKGDKGDKGDRGPKGERGPIGPRGPRGFEGEPGQDGSNGLSAYQVAQQHGYAGTEQEWLTSLKGEKGEDGTVTFDDLDPELKASLKGDPGEPGEPGVTPLISISVSVDNTSSTTPQATVTKTGSDEEPLFAIAFTGLNGKSAYDVAVEQGYEGDEESWLESLKGEKGDDGVQGVKMDGDDEPLTPDGDGVVTIPQPEIPDAITSVIANNELVFQTPDGQSVKGKVGVTTGADGLLHLTLTDEEESTYSSPIAGLRVVENALQYSNDGETWTTVQTFGKLAIKYVQASDPASGDVGDLALVGSMNAYVLKVYASGSWVSVGDIGSLDLTSDGITMAGEDKTLTQKIREFSESMEDIDLSNSVKGTETAGAFDGNSNTRVMFFAGAVNDGDEVYVKAKTGYRFVISGYRVVVSSSSDITTTNFVEQYENAWVTEDTYRVPSTVKSVVIKVSNTSNGNIASADRTKMIDVARKGVRNFYEFTDMSEDEDYMEIALAHDAGTPSQPDIKPVARLPFRIYKELVDNDNLVTGHVVSELFKWEFRAEINTIIQGANDGNGSFVTPISQTRILVCTKELQESTVIHVKAKSGYRFVIYGYKVVIRSSSDVTSANSFEQYEQAWVTEDYYTVPSTVKSVVIKVSKTDDSNISVPVAPASIDDYIEFNKKANIKDAIVALTETTEEQVEQIHTLETEVLATSDPIDCDITNYLQGKSTNSSGALITMSTRTLFLLGQVSQGQIVRVTPLPGYKCVLDAYKTVVTSESQITADNFHAEYIGVWQTDVFDYEVPSVVKSVVLKVAKSADTTVFTDNDDYTAMVSAAIINKGGLVERMETVEDELGISTGKPSVEYSGAPIVLVKHKMQYGLIGQVQDSMQDGGKRAGEGLAVYGDYLFRLFINGMCCVYDISSGAPVLASTFALGSHGLADNHCNCAQFGLVDSGNGFPYLYVANCKYPICYVENINASGSTLVQTITLSSSDSFSWCNVCCGDDGYLYAVGIFGKSTVDGTMKIKRYLLPSVGAGNVTLTDNSDADGGFTFTIPYDGATHCLQGMEIRDGKIFLPMNGTANASQGIIRVIDIASKSVQVDIPIPFEAKECEDVSVYGKNMYIQYYDDGDNVVYSNVYKLTF